MTALHAASRAFVPSAEVHRRLEESRTAFRRSSRSLLSHQSVGQQVQVGSNGHVRIQREPRQFESNGRLHLSRVDRLARQPGVFHPVAWTCKCCRAEWCQDVCLAHLAIGCSLPLRIEGDYLIMEVQSALPDAWVRIRPWGFHVSQPPRRDGDLWFRNPPLAPLDWFADDYKPCRPYLSGATAAEKNNEQSRLADVRKAVCGSCVRGVLRNNMHDRLIDHVLFISAPLHRTVPWSLHCRPSAV